jgi:hypothetical protein
MHQLLGINGFVPLFFLISRAILLRTGVKFRNLWGSSLPINVKFYSIYRLTTNMYVQVYLKKELLNSKQRQ